MISLFCIIVSIDISKTDLSRNGSHSNTWRVHPVGASIDAGEWCNDVKVGGEGPSTRRVWLWAETGEKTRDYSDVEGVDRALQQDIPHPWPDLEEMFEIVGSKNNSWQFKANVHVMYIIFGIFIILDYSNQSIGLIVTSLLIRRLCLIQQ